MADPKPNQSPSPNPAPQSAPQDEVRLIIRIANTDLDGKKHILYALRKIKGVNVMYANYCLYKAGINIRKKAGELTDAEVKKLDEVLTRPIQAGMPTWMVNRRKDPETGVDMHILSGDLRFTVDYDIKMMKKVKNYKGMRHAWGQPVRGQRTKSNFRKNKGKANLGVIKKKTAPSDSGDKKDRKK
jgi:small subunit ribosomal protein S13